MYIRRMKTKKTGRNHGGEIRYDDPPREPQILKDAAPALPPPEEVMVRTQIYLSKAEMDFVQREGARQGLPMAAVIRQFIDDKMEAPDTAWTHNPMLAPSVEDA